LNIANHLAREFRAPLPNTKLAIDITCFETGEGRLYLCAVKNLYSEVIGLVDGYHQAERLMLQAVLVALWQRE